MKTIIKTRNHGEMVFTANHALDHSTYVYLDGKQICEGGGHRGNTLMCDGSQKNLDKVARKWWNRHLAKIREYGLESIDWDSLL